MNTLSALVGALLLAATLAFAAYAQEASPDAPSASAEAVNSAWHSLDFWKEAIRISGFARLVGGYLDEEKATYLDYDDSISFGEHSLFALQTDVDFSEQFSFTTQLLAHASHRRDSGVEWAYLSYRPTRNWQFKAGKLRTPFFIYSDTLDVGLTYPWIVPPQQVYLPYVFPEYIGLNAAWQFSIKDWNLETEVYWGKFDNDVNIGHRQVDAKVDDLRGLVLRLNRGNLRLHMSYNRGDTTLTVPELSRFVKQLRGFGFERSANSLEYSGDTSFLQAAISYETLDYFLKAEWMSFGPRVRSSVPTVESYYLSGGYTFNPITIHATFANLNAKKRRPVEEIPAGVPQLARLRSAYRGVFNNANNEDDLQSLSVGLRWDLSPSVALKAEWVHLLGDRDEDAFFIFDQNADFDRKANLFMFAVEWVF